MPLPDNCCDCTCKSFCNEQAAIIRFGDGSYDPPTVPRVVQRVGPNGTYVPQVEQDWLFLYPEWNVDRGNVGMLGVTSHACAWDLVSGSHSLMDFELLPTWISRPALQAVLETVGLTVASVQLSKIRQAAGVVNAAIASKTLQEQAEFWDQLIAAGFRDLWYGPPVFGLIHRRDITLTSEGTVLTRTTANKPVQVVEMQIAATARQPGDTSGTLFTFDPLTTDVRIGCDETGGNQQYTLRVRVEHGQQIEPTPTAYLGQNSEPLTSQSLYTVGSSSWGDADLRSHSLIRHSQSHTGTITGFFVYEKSGGPISAVEALIYLELLDASGNAVESVLVPAMNAPPKSSLFGGLSVRWGWSVSGGQLHVNANVVFLPGDVIGMDSEDQSGFSGNMGFGARVLRHLFAPQPAELLSRIAVSLTRAKRHSVQLRHRQFRIETTTTSNGLPLSPSIPADPSPYCDAGHQDYAQNQQPDRWPWRKTPCTVWRRHGGRVTQGLPSFSECMLTITADPFWDSLHNAIYRDATLIGGTYNLGRVSDSGEMLMDNCFWLTDEPGSSYTADNGDTVTLTRLEFSLVVGALLQKPCNGGWGVQGVLRGRAVFNGTISRFFAETLDLGEAFLRGEEVNAVTSLPTHNGIQGPFYLGHAGSMAWSYAASSAPFDRLQYASYGQFSGGAFYNSWPYTSLKYLTELKLKLVA